jgi:hypothetical protein
MERVPGTREVRAATLNLWGQHGAWDQRRAVLADGLRELRPERDGRDVASRRVPSSLIHQSAGRVVPRNPHPGSRIERPLGASGSPSEGPPTEGQGPHVVVANRYAGGG